MGLDVDLAGLIPLGEVRDEGTGDQDTGNGSHGEAGVDQLSLLEVLQNLGVGAEAEGVEPEVTGHAANTHGTRKLIYVLRTSSERVVKKSQKRGKGCPSRFDFSFTCRQGGQGGWCPGTRAACRRTWSREPVKHQKGQNVSTQPDYATLTAETRE